MKWENCFAMACAGTFMLYRVHNYPAGELYCVMSVETEEPVKWICSRAAAYAWMQQEALLVDDEIDHVLWGADEWHKTKSRQASVSRRLASIPAAAKPAAGPSPRS